jgi:hypothetical protein
MSWYDGIIGFFETAWSIPERLQYKKPISIIELQPGDPVVEGSATRVKWLNDPSYGNYWSQFNPDEAGLAPLDQNKADTAQEIAKQEGEPVVKSSLLDVLYGGMLKACYEDQYHGHCNPNASRACQNLAIQNDYSELILTERQRNALGITPPGDQPSDIILQNEGGYIPITPDKTPQPSTNRWNEFVKGVRAGYNLEKKPGQVGEPEDQNVFQESLIKWAAGINNIAKTPEYAVYLIIGGAVLLLLLVIKR